MAIATAEDAPSDGTKAHGRFLTLKYSAASMCGLAVDLTVLKILTGLGLAPAWARLVSLFLAMQTTFLINGLLVFKTLDWSCAPHQWLAYMTLNGFGNFCNYFAFTTLLSLHRPVLSNHVFAVCAGGFVAWVMNYAFTRLIVFSPRGRRFMERLKAMGCKPRAKTDTAGDFGVGAKT